MSINKALGAFRLLVSASIVFSIGWQVQDRLIHDLFRPSEYFAFFTIDSGMIAAVAMAVAGVRSLRGMPVTQLLNRVLLSVVSYEIVVSVVYNLLLRGSANDVRDGNYHWPQAPNEILHVWAPIFIFLDFLITTKGVRFKEVFWVLLFPVAWAVFSAIRGVITGWWPYWFIDPTGPDGVPGMLKYIAGILVFLLVAGGLALSLNKLVRRR
jgi:hypothetical protein